MHLKKLRIFKCSVEALVPVVTLVDDRTEDHELLPLTCLHHGCSWIGRRQNGGNLEDFMKPMASG